MCDAEERSAGSNEVERRSARLNDEQKRLRGGGYAPLEAIAARTTRISCRFAERNVAFGGYILKSLVGDSESSMSLAVGGTHDHRHRNPSDRWMEYKSPRPEAVPVRGADWSRSFEELVESRRFYVLWFMLRSFPSLTYSLLAFDSPGQAARADGSAIVQ